ncbi:MAG: hypothetical protein ACRD3O_07170 [Terriglobia bacterium]
MKITKLLLVPALAAAMLAAACSTSWITTAEQYVAVLVPAVQDVIGILAIAGAKGVSTTTLNTVSEYGVQATNDLNTINALLAKYNSANAATTMAKINVAANDAKQNLNLMLPALHITNAATVSKVTDAVDLAVNTITELEALLPSATSTTPTLRRAALKAPKPSALQQQFNQIFAK